HRLHDFKFDKIPKTIDLGLFRLGTSNWLGGRVLDASALKALEAISGVDAVYPKLRVPLPLGARGGQGLFGRALYTDLFMQGVPRELLLAEVGEAFVDREDVVPVVISDQLIDVYNASVAASLGTPRLTTSTLVGFSFDLIIGHSMMLGQRGAARVGSEKARLVGVSRYALRLGATVPIETARRLIATYGTSSSEGERYDAVLLRARSPELVGNIVAAVEALGLAVDETAKRVALLVDGATLMASLVGLLALGLAALSIAHSFLAQLSERRHELGILRAVGARRRDLVAMVLLEAALLGTAGGAAGLVLAHLLAAGAHQALGALTARLPLVPPTLILLPTWVDLLALAAAIVAACGGALWPALRAAYLPIADALSEG
ncbi:MAG: ABC transporter permease, partial [Myxococcota bacterium]